MSPRKKCRATLLLL